MTTAEQTRLDETAARTRHWRRWGPYLAERQWGTVREDYSADGDAWGYVTHDMARSYAYRWGEDGLAGISDNHQRLCFALALWNGRDPFLKERLFGLSNPEGNHGEDVKECYWHLDNTPTHACMRYLYRYPQAAFPYEALVLGNSVLNRRDPELEIVDTGVFNEDRYFDVTLEYAKADAEDMGIRIHAFNAGPEPAELHLIPMLWFRNTWAWTDDAPRPALHASAPGSVAAAHDTLGPYSLAYAGNPEVMFTENETNGARLYDEPSRTRFTKDAFHQRIIYDLPQDVAYEGGTKCGLWYRHTLAPGETHTLRLRLSAGDSPQSVDDATVDAVFDLRSREADEFYESVYAEGLSEERRGIARQALAGMLWSKQWYHYAVDPWLEGDAAMPPPPADRKRGRNREWTHLYNDDVLSMPDTWEYPWYAVWDSAFHAVTLALVDPEYAKRQLTVFTREWYMHPNGQLPAYEWSLSDVNPPVHAWATWRVYGMDRARTGVADTAFLESVFHKLLMNFTWWVNRKDLSGNNIFQGGFLGMDNIGVFDRSTPPPVGGRLEQSDGTSWMAMYCLNMLAMAWELSKISSAYEDIASKFFEHFLYIADAIHNIDGTGASLWHEEDGFFYDQLLRDDGTREAIGLRSMVGLIPLLAVEILDHERIDQLPGFKRRMDWFQTHRGDLTRPITCVFQPGGSGRCAMALVNPDQLKRVLAVVLDENEFLSPFGIRSLSKYHAARPYTFKAGEYTTTVGYEPGASTSPLFGGNSNWRGPIWFPVNFLIIEALRRYHALWGDTFRVECPTGSGRMMNLSQVADAIAQRLVALFEQRDATDPQLFHEYFDGDTGSGLGASHQTGWTALVANLIMETD